MADIAESVATTGTPAPRKKIKWEHVTDHAILIAGAMLMIVPIIIALTTASLPDIEIERQGLQLSVGDQFDDNVESALFQPGGFSGEVTGVSMLTNSFILGIGFAIGKIIVGMMAAYAIVYFRFSLTRPLLWTITAASVVGTLIYFAEGSLSPYYWIAAFDWDLQKGLQIALVALVIPIVCLFFRNNFAAFSFWIIFTTLLLPLEVRILPSYEVIVGMGLTNTYTGLIVPLIASATATFFFRQFFMSVPEELVEAARIDGAGPVKFFIDILVPLSKTMIAAMFIIMFVFGWNQYLWPTLITTDEDMFTLVRGIRQIIQDQEGVNIPEYGRGIMLAMLAMLPPVLIVVFFQSWFVKGLTESDK